MFSRVDVFRRHASFSAFAADSRGVEVRLHFRDASCQPHGVILSWRLQPQDLDIFHSEGFPAKAHGARGGLPHVGAWCVYSGGGNAVELSATGSKVYV